MIIAIPTSRPDLDGSVEHKLGTAAHLLIVETDDMSFEALDGPPRSSGPGAGVAAVSLAVSKGAQALLVGHVAPHLVNAMQKQSVDVVTGVSGTAAEAVADYLASREEAGGTEKVEPQEWLAPEEWREAVHKSLRQFHSLLPRLIGVILLLGLFRGVVSRENLLSLFSGSILEDSLWGGAVGSILAGNPVNSYVIGESLLQFGVGVAGAMALMLTWVNVGVIQLPAEAAALGWRFTLLRNGIGFVVAVFMALCVGLWAGGLA
ncbi:NifB/NifX family molybdenum-iron cluster-binding protein [uncultured Pseudodesulfovibrio sp.]|uniref:NifB/NifX family molybdenum-iron cluster-binding protein n=1 Tax=uncultured Pseudodesulfovibrio sp. TaxID=2035858 RepID=UPI0029C8A0A4|nr:NifB/NifX family molybdenum-iron cluster-binding protein [uncultured Pseudodesulfovibrio sp.]